jgi:lipoprotein NlpI
MKYAREHMIKVGYDPRVPMSALRSLYQSLTSRDIDAVFRDVKEGNPTPEELKERLFYAHLYISLYYDVRGDKKLALEYISKAADNYKIGHHMWDIAALHKKRLRGELEH